MIYRQLDAVIATVFSRMNLLMIGQSRAINLQKISDAFLTHFGDNPFKLLSEKSKNGARARGYGIPAKNCRKLRGILRWPSCLGDADPMEGPAPPGPRDHSTIPERPGRSRALHERSRRDQLLTDSAIEGTFSSAAAAARGWASFFCNRMETNFDTPRSSIVTP